MTAKRGIGIIERIRTLWMWLWLLPAEWSAFSAASAAKDMLWMAEHNVAYRKRMEAHGESVKSIQAYAVAQVDTWWLLKSHRESLRQRIMTAKGD